MATLPPKSHGIRGVAKDTDGNLVTSGHVIAVNISQTGNPVTKGDIDGRGNFAIDAANFGSYSDGDTILWLLDEGETIEGQAVVDRIARDVIMQTRQQIQNVSAISNTLFSPIIVSSFPHPYDEERQMFRRTVEIEFNARNINE